MNGWVSSLLQSRFVRSVGTYGLASAANGLLGFALLPVLTRYLTPDDFGLIAMFLLLGAILRPLVGLCLDAAILRRVVDTPEAELGRMVGVALLFNLAGLVAVGGVVLVGVGQIAAWTLVPPFWIRLAVVYAALESVLTIPLAVLRMRMRARAFAGVQLVRGAGAFGLSLWLVVGLELDWQGRLYALLAAVLLASGVGVLLLWRGGLLRPDASPARLRPLLSYGAPLVPHVLGGVAIAVTDRLFLAHMVGLDEVGIYSVAMQLGLVIALLEDSFNKGWTPSLFRRLQGEDRALIVIHIYAYCLFLLLFALGLALVAPFLVELLFGRDFTRVGAFMFWVSLGLAFGGIYKMPASLLFYAEKTHLIATVSVISAVVNVVANYVLIKANGGLGAAQATCVAYLVSLVLAWLLSLRAVRMPWSLDWRGS